MAEEPLQAIITVVIVATVAVFGFAILSPMVQTAEDSGTSYGDTAFDPTVGETQVLDRNVKDDPSFFKIDLTKEHGITLKGDGHVAASAPENLTVGSWTACSTGQLDDSRNVNETYTLLATDNETIIIQYDDGDWQGFYNDSGTFGNVTLNADSETSWTSICLRHNDTADDLTLHVDGTEATSAMGTGARSPGENWEGDIDEVRFWNQTLSSSKMDEYSSEPVAGIGVEDDARWMFEEGSGSTTDAFYIDASATLEGDASWGAGLSDPELSEGTDYDREVAPLSVTPLSGGLIDASPVLYVEWQTGLGGALKAITQGAGNALSLVAVFLLVTIASLVLGIVARLRQQ